MQLAVLNYSLSLGERVGERAGQRPLFYVGSRGHHGDVGAITPDSMPPFSTRIEEEGVQELGKRAEHFGLDLVQASMRRRHGAFGLADGQPGQVGVNRVLRVDGTVEQLGHIGQAEMQAGDVFEICTPGGGGFGRPAA